MVKKGIITIVAAAIISCIYIFGIDHYSRVPVKMTWLYSVVTEASDTAEEVMAGETPSGNEGIQYTETGIKMTGIIYDEKLSIADLVQRADEMVQAMSHEDSCSRICREQHCMSGRSDFKTLSNGIQVTAEGESEGCSYHFTLTSQKDIHYNSYYELTITGSEEMKHLDNMRSHGYDLLKRWQVPVKEGIYFKGSLHRQLQRQECEALREQLFDSLHAVQTNYYQDEVNESTCAYYAYSPYIKEYYREKDGRRTNVQAAFAYNEIKDETEVIIAFPFYNGLF